MSEESDIDVRPNTPPDTPMNGKTPRPKQTVTRDDCFKYLQKFVNIEKKGLDRFYDEKALIEKSKVAETMASQLLDQGCGKEVALQLSLLTLYDIAMLLDDSESMLTEENGARKDTMKITMEAITGVYDLANPEGLLSVRFFNNDAGFKKIKQKNLSWLWKRFKYGGVTRIGSSLSEKILKKFVWTDQKMQKPLLVMMITDGAVEGERDGLLRDVIANCVKRIESNTVNQGQNAVAFHFSQVGNDEEAKEFLEKLDDHTVFGNYVDCLDVKHRLKDLPNNKWSILPKLLLGAIIEAWDKIGDEVDVEETMDGVTKPIDSDSDEEAGEDE